MSHATIATSVVAEQQLPVSWDAAKNQLTIHLDPADNRHDMTFSNTAITEWTSDGAHLYVAVDDVPAGQVIVTPERYVPNLVSSLTHAKIIEVLRLVPDDNLGGTVAIARVLI